MVQLIVKMKLMLFCYTSVALAVIALMPCHCPSRSYAGTRTTDSQAILCSITVKWCHCLGVACSAVPQRPSQHRHMYIATGNLPGNLELETLWAMISAIINDHDSSGFSLTVRPKRQ